MASIPLIQPSFKSSADGTRSVKRNIFSNPTEDIYGDNVDLDLDKDGGEGDFVSWVHLDPSPIGKDTTVEKWSKSNRTIQATFRPSTNELAVYVAGKKAAEEFPVQQKVTTKDNVVFLCQETIPDVRIPFIKQMFSVFVDMTARDPYTTPDLYQRSFDRYYEGIERYLLQLDVLSNAMDESDNTEQITREAELMDKLRAIWQLAEYVFLTTDDKKPIAFLYGEWLTRHDGAMDLEVGEALLAKTGKLTQPEFWPYVYQCLLRGMKNSVVFLVEQALSEEEDENTADGLEGFLAVLRGIPSSETLLPDGKSRGRHGMWQEQCRKFAKSPLLLYLGSEADTAMSILTGDRDAILDTAESWEEAFSAILLYSDPECSRHDLAPILNACVERYLKDTEASLLDKIKVGILEMDAIKTIRYCGNFHPWLVAHLSDVFQQYGYLDMSDIQLQDTIVAGWDSNIRDFFITSYAHSLMANPRLWEEIAGYLLNCGHTGRAMLSEWICHVPMESSTKAHKVLKFCKDNNLADSLRSINRVMAVEEEKRGEYVEAIQHFIASKDVDRVAKVADNMMLKCLAGNLDLDQALSSLPETTSPNDHVEFLRSYASFQREYKNGSVVEAAETLVAMLATEKAPKKYWAILLMDALPLLENKEKVLFDTHDTYELMQSLEEIIGSQHKPEYLQLLPPATSSTSDDTLVDQREKQLDVVRLSLVRNLARSLVHPPKRDDEDEDMFMDL
ncbi:Nucleoporin nup85 [Gryganskiella cystojenkinii]|nr:Nucleoporin nup85 [Gryganskiella cystojenkinii]